jgi:hypothetical protein
MASKLAGNGDRVGGGGGAELSWEGQMYQLLLYGGLSTCFLGVDKWFPWPAKNETIFPVHVVRMKLDLNSLLDKPNLTYLRVVHRLKIYQN